MADGGTTALLPAAFSDLEAFMDWAQPSEEARHRRRASSSMSEIRAFYDAMRQRLDAVLEHLNGFALERLPPPEQRLLQMCLSLAEAACAVEMFEAPDMAYGFPIERFKPVHHRASQSRT